MKTFPITFSFGANWQSFVKTVSSDTLLLARNDIVEWLGEDTIIGKTVLDIGCGSGIHSLVFCLLGAKEILSFDYDPKSVKATRSLWEKAGQPAHWQVVQGSILDKNFLQSIKSEYEFDIVYAWGVLHHTGAMWEAIENSCNLVKKGGLYWIALYDKGPTYESDLALKIKYNQASAMGKKLIVAENIARIIWRRLCRFGRRKFVKLLLQGRFRELREPLAWNQKKERGMNVYHDLIDWLGGLPYEVATVDEVVEFHSKKGFVLERIQTGEANNIYLFSV